MRWTNYFILFIPLIVSLLSKKHNKRLLSEKYFYFSSSLAFLLFLLHTRLIYGVFTFSPFLVYGEESLGNRVYESLFIDFFNTIYSVINDIFIILFTKNLEYFGFHRSICLHFLLIVNFVKFTSSERLASSNIFIFCSDFIQLAYGTVRHLHMGLDICFAYSFIHIFISKTWRKQKQYFVKHYINFFQYLEFWRYYSSRQLKELNSLSCR